MILITGENAEISTEEGKEIPEFEAKFAIAGLLAVAYILKRNRK